MTVERLLAACELLGCAALNAANAALSLWPDYVELRRGPHHFSERRVHERYLHIYESRTLTPAHTVLVFIHGGGWSAGGLRTHFPYVFGYEWLGRAMASRGIHTALISYPLVVHPPHIEYGVYAALALFAAALARILAWVLLPLWFWAALAVPCYALSALLIKQRVFSGAVERGDGATFEQQRQIVAAQYAMVARFFPTHELVVVGHSAGGHHAAVLGLAPGAAKPPLAVIGLSGVYDLPDVAAKSWPARLLLLPRAFDMTRLEEHSPLHMLSRMKSAPSTMRWFLVSPVGDAPVLVAQADALHAALSARLGGDVVRRVRGVGVGHGIGMVASEDVWALVEAECRRYVPRISYTWR